MLVHIKKSGRDGYFLKSWGKTSFSGLSLCSVHQLRGSAGHCGSASIYWCLRQFFSSGFSYIDKNEHVLKSSIQAWIRVVGKLEV